MPPLLVLGGFWSDNDYDSHSPPFPPKKKEKSNTEIYLYIPICIGTFEIERFDEINDAVFVRQYLFLTV